MRDIQIYLTQVHAEIPADADRGVFPLTLPFVEGLDVRFKTPVTFIVGENGSGKSTLLEALVDLANLPVRGGGRNELADHGGESELAPFLRSSWAQRPGHGFFFRAEFEMWL